MRKNQSSKLTIGVALLFEIILIVTAIASIVTRQWKDLSLSLLAMACLILPFVITRIANIKKIELPSNFQLLTLVFIFLAQYLGELRHFYQLYWWWDLLLHAVFGSYAVIVGLYLMKGTIKREQETTEERFALLTIILAFCFSLALGTLWEMFEFIGDYLFKANMIKGGLEDTATDLLIKILAAFITSLINYYRSLKDKVA